MVLYGSSVVEGRAARAAAAAQRGLIEPPDRRNFPLHAGRGLERVMGRERVYDVEWTASSANARDGFQPAQMRDKVVYLGYRIGPLRADPLATGAYSALVSEGRVAVPRVESGSSAQDPYANYVEPRGLQAKWLALRAHVVDRWGKMFFARRFASGNPRAFEPNSLRAAELARLAGRFALRDRILEAHRPTVCAGPFDEYADEYFAEHHLGEREMHRALRSGLVLVDADDVDALKAFHTAASFVGMSTRYMQAQLTAVDPAAPLDTLDTSALALPPTLATSFELDGGFNPLWQAPEFYADARASYTHGLHLCGLSDAIVKPALIFVDANLRSATEANALAQRVVRAHLGAGRANDLFRSSTWVEHNGYGDPYVPGGYYRDVTADVQGWLDADLVPAAARLAAKQRIVDALLIGMPPRLPSPHRPPVSIPE